MEQELINEKIKDATSYSYHDYIALLKKTEEKEQAMQERLWIDSSVGKFDELLRVNYSKSIEEFGKVVLQHIAELTHAYSGVFYIKNKDKTSLRPVAGYCCAIEKLPQEIEFNDGIVGQAAEAQKLIHFEKVPAQNVIVKASATIDVHSVGMFAIPLIFNEQVYGVIEMLFITGVARKHLELLQVVSKNIATMLESITNNAITKRLLMETQEQSEALRSQEEELRQNMEEMQATQDELQRQIASTLALKGELDARVNLLNRSALVSETDLYGNIIYANEKFCEVAQYTLEEVVGKPHNIVRHPDNPKSLFKELWDTIKSGKIFKGQFKNRAKDGSDYWVETNIAPVLDESGKAIRYLGIRFDITEQMNKRAEVERLLLESQAQQNELTQQEEELRQSVEEMQVTQEELERQVRLNNTINQELKLRIDVLNQFALVTESDLHGNITYCNPKFEEVSKYTSKEAIGKPHNILRHPDMPKSVFKELWATIQSGNTFRGRILNKAKDGSTYIVDATIVPVLDENGKPMKYVSIRYNVTDHMKELEEKDKQILDLQEALKNIKKR